MAPASPSRGGDHADLDHDSDATEDEVLWDAASLSPSSRAGGACAPQAKRARGHRALQLLVEDRTAPASKPLALHDAAIKAAIQRGQEVGARPRRRSVPTPRFGIQHSKLPTLHLERDSAILQLVLEKRPFLIHRPSGKRELLALVVRALKANGVWAMTTDTVRRQIKWLGHVRLEEGHPEHANLVAATELNAMVTEYYETSDTILKSVLQLINADAATQPSEITFDDVLLLEVLQRRPFEVKKKRSLNVVWDALATALNERLGVKVFFSGTSCKDRVSRLRAVARRARQDPTIELSEAQRRMLADLEHTATPSVKQRRSRAWNDAPEPEEINYLSFATEEEASDEDESTTKRARYTSPHDNAVVDGDTTPGRLEHRVLSVLLKETVRMRPLFGGEDQMALWKEILAAVNRCAGRVVFPDAFECADFVDRLVGSDGAPTTPDFVDLTEDLRELLAQIDWPRREQVSRSTSSGVPESQISVMSKQSRHHCDTTRQNDASQRTVEIKPEPPSHPICADSLAKTLATRNQELEAWVVRERREFGAERAMLRQQVVDLKATVHNLQAKLHTADEVSSAWMQRLDDERRQHHVQLETLMNLLKTERVAQRQETRAILETIAVDRREAQQPPMPLPSLKDRSAYTTAHQQVYNDESGATLTSRPPQGSQGLPNPW